MLMNMDTATYPVHLPATTLTTDLTTVYGQDCIVEYLAFSNTHTSTILVTVRDGGGKTFLPGISVLAGTVEIASLPERGLLFRGGVKWLASVADKIDAWIVVRPI